MNISCSTLQDKIPEGRTWVDSCNRHLKEHLTAVTKLLSFLEITELLLKTAS